MEVEHLWNSKPWTSKWKGSFEERNFHGEKGALLIFNYQQNLSWESWSMTKSSTSRTKNMGSSNRALRTTTFFSRRVFRVRKNQETTNWKQLISSWWFQLIWKIFYCQIGSFPQIGLKIENIWNHHLVSRAGPTEHRWKLLHCASSLLHCAP